MGPGVLPSSTSRTRNGSNSQAILIVVLVGVVVLLVIAGLWVLAYFQFT